MQPGFSATIVAAAVDVFVEHMRVTTSESGHLLLESNTGFFHQRGVTVVPEGSITFNSSANAMACTLDDVLMQNFAGQGRQFSMPVNNLGWSRS
jgi:hypothetical protein